MRVDDGRLLTQGFVEDSNTGLMYVNPTIDSPELEFAMSQLGSPTAIHWREAIRIIGLGEQDNFDGLNFLDIGGACSNLTAWLLSRGANAFSIDPGYQDLTYMIQKAQISTQEKADPEENMQAIQEFKSSVESHPDHYITGWATNVPKPSGYFDYITAIRSVFFYIDINADLLARAINEQIRLLKKPGGKFVGYPLLTEGPLQGFEQTRYNNQRALATALDTRTDVNYQVRQFQANGKPLPGLILDIYTK